MFAANGEVRVPASHVQPFLICFIKGFSIRLEIVSTPVGTKLIRFICNLVILTVSAQGLFEGAPGGESVL